VKADSRTPFQEAVSIITVAAILVSVLSYVSQGVPVLGDFVSWVSQTLYSIWPFLSVFPAGMTGAAFLGLGIYVCGMPLATLLARRMSQAQLQNVERHTLELKRTRAQIKKRERVKDDWIVR
jgi:hypothetical protein